MNDRDLGMDRKISRRDFINGVGVLLVGAAVPDKATPEGAEPPPTPLSRASGRSGAPIPYSVTPDQYPPLKEGMRGTHDGAFTVAHKMAREGYRDWGEPIDTGTDYDIVVVGGGLSGLSAAYFYLKEKPDARVLILDNHDDFGGHARRNEWHYKGRMYIGTGGSFNLGATGASDAFMGMLEDLDIDLDAFDEGGAYDKGFFERHGLKKVFYFDEKTYGRHAFVASHMSSYMPTIPTTDETNAERVAQMPFSEASRRELLALYEMSEDRTPGGIFSELDVISRTTYKDFLERYCGITQHELLEWFCAMTSAAGQWGEVRSPVIDLTMAGLPGLGATSLRWLKNGRAARLFRYFIDMTTHFPDGNATIARMLVRRLNPAVSDSGTTMRNVQTAAFDYSKLDIPEAQVRIRLDSTVVDVRHNGDPKTADSVSVSYVRDGQTERVKGRHVVLACWNRVIPHLWHEIPQHQVEALRLTMKTPVLYTNLLLRNWHPWKKAGVGAAFNANHRHTQVNLDMPISLGEYRHSVGPDDPIVLYMTGAPRGFGEVTARNRAQTGRMQLLGLSFEEIEREIRVHMAEMLGSYGFDPAMDIVGMTTNRWPHGYAMPQSPIFDPEYAEGEEPHVVGRKPLGRVAIANADAGAMDMFNAALDQAHRAVGELLG